MFPAIAHYNYDSDPDSWLGNGWIIGWIKLASAWSVARQYVLRPA